MAVATAAVFAFCGLAFGFLMIRDEGEWLALRFWPLPVLHRSFHLPLTFFSMSITRNMPVINCPAI